MPHQIDLENSRRGRLAPRRAVNAIITLFIVLVCCLGLVCCRGNNAGVAAIGPAATLSATSLYFGSYAVGATAGPKILSLTNSGNTALAITSITLTGVNAKDFAQKNNCGIALAAGAKCSVQVTFKPSAAGTRTGILNITDNPTGSPQAVILSGTATGKYPDAAASPTAVLSPSGLNFSGQPVHTTSAPQSVTLTNSGTTALSISGLGVTGANSSDFVQNNNCGSSVAAGANCTIVVLFTPSAAGARVAALSISDNASRGSETVSLSGSGGGGGGHNVVLFWTASPTSDVIGYNVYRGTTSGGESSTPLNSTPINATTYADENVTAGAEYHYLVTSVTSDGVTQSAPSNEAAATLP